MRPAGKFSIGIRARRWRTVVDLEWVNVTRRNLGDIYWDLAEDLHGDHAPVDDGARGTIRAILSASHPIFQGNIVYLWRDGAYAG